MQHSVQPSMAHPWARIFFGQPTDA